MKAIMSESFSRNFLIATVLLFGATLLTSCGGDKESMISEACGYFVRGTDRLNVDNTAYDSFERAYKIFDKLSKKDPFFTKFASVSYELSVKKGRPVPWVDIDEVADYCGDPVFSD